MSPPIGPPRPGGRVRVAVVDDHPVILDGVAAWCASAGEDVRLVGTYLDVASLRADPEHPVDVVVLDLRLDDESSPPATVAGLVAEGCAVVVMSADAEPVSVKGAVEAGALSYVPKVSGRADLIAAVRAAARGESHVTPELAEVLAGGDGWRPALSPQESRALVLFGSGLLLRTVARQMGVGEPTVRTYLQRARRKYAERGVRIEGRVDWYEVGQRDGWVREVGPPGQG
ncbi:response regulator transcription factor [Pseudokineococcus sp. 1T1Z-3]|uniref:response regulator transcription factor n=1 Tax=Pseudokineococcus sp. 1T1Z-3 TaxID=3132745 RepID=UPI0030A58F6D